MIDDTNIENQSPNTQKKTRFVDLDDSTTTEMTFLVRSVTGKVDKKGNNFCEIEATDGTQMSIVRLWKTSAEEAGFASGDVLTASIYASEYNGNMSFSCQQGSYKVEDSSRSIEFVMSAPISIDVMWQWIVNEVSSMRPSLRFLMERLVIMNKAEYCRHSAAKSIHHNYIGGLLYHSYRMAKSAKELAAIYDADVDMCVSGALVHDLGKLLEMTTDAIGVSDYTVKGQLEGHLSIGCAMIDEVARLMPQDIADVAGDDVMCLRHIVASHHGEQSMGAIKPPATKEAMIVSAIDMLDMKLTIYDDAVSDVVEGNMAPDTFPIGRTYKPTGATYV